MGYFYYSDEDLSEMKVCDSCGDCMGYVLNWYDLREIDIEDEIKWRTKETIEKEVPKLMEEISLLREENKKLNKKVRKMKYKLYGK